MRIFCLILNIFRINFLILSLISVMLSKELFASSQNESDVLEVHNLLNKRMGIEIETSAIKIYSPSDKKIGFKIFPTDTPYWIIEEDTSDGTFKDMEAYKHIDKNLELKTTGGLTEEEINSTGGKIQFLLNYLHTHEEEVLEIDTDYLQIIFSTARVEAYANNPSKILIKAKREDTIIRPQISYQMPLFLLPMVFEHLAELSHKKIKNFLSCLDPIVPENLNAANIEKKLGSQMSLAVNVGYENYVKLFLKRRVAHTINALEPQTNVRGFCYLFTYYWYSLFNSKKSDEGFEPGPKQFLAILSRVPLSQIFDKLCIAEQNAVRSIFDPILIDLELLPDITVPEFPFTLIQYAKDAKMVNSMLTVMEWYRSIYDVSFRKVNGKKTVDLLSPPPGFDGTDFSMGYLDMDIHSSGIPLFEIRGYAKIKHEDHPPQINDIEGLIRNESNWFFNILS